MSVIRVLFTTKKLAPINVKKLEYFVSTDSYEQAHNIASKQLINDIVQKFLCYFDKIIMCNVNLLGAL